ncbi:UNVERIFIED_CONTAM: hypothetical protein HDU68_004075 [Siphonaria sp. JEL0065]|nr:hypothetical protein HDU68_004075 [Siphonaria sp. JEL0065]
MSGNNTWMLLKKPLPSIPAELPKDRIADLLKTTAANLGASATADNFETKELDKPGDGSAFVARIGGDDVLQLVDGWGWLDDEARAEHTLSDGSVLVEFAKNLGFSKAANHAVITRRRFHLASTPDLQFLHYLRIKDNVPKVPVAKDAIKVEPTTLKRKKPANQDDFWGFEDQSVPTLVSLARYKRNHEFINELFSPLPLQPKEKFESKVTQEDIQKLEAEIKALEEQNKALLATAAAHLHSDA